MLEVVSPPPVGLDFVAARLRSQLGASFFHRIARNLLVEQLGREELASLHDAFEHVDADRDGVLTEGDLVSSLQHVGFEMAVAREVLHAVDIHGRGYLEFREFAAECFLVVGLPSEKLQGALEKLFLQLRGPGGGVAFSSLLNRFAYVAEEDAENLAAQFRIYDRHGDGQLTKDEFFGIWGFTPSPTWKLTQIPESPTPLVSILKGCWKDASVRGADVDSWKFTTFGQPSLAKAGGRWYYEICICKCDYPQIGWADEAFELDDSACDNGVGDDGHSWGVDGVRGSKWHNGGSDYTTTWPRPVVVGCAVDLESNPTRMFFSTDGKWDEAPAFEGILFTGGIYPAASGVESGSFLFSAQDCLFAPPDRTYLHLVGGSPECSDSVHPLASP